MPLPFIVPQNFKQTYTIADETGLTLEILKLGSLTWQEHITWINMVRALQKEEEMSMAEYEGRLCVALLKLRFKLPVETLESEILVTPDGESLPESMVAAILTFFERERDRWKIAPEPEAEEKKEPKKK